MKKYLISIESAESSRMAALFAQTTFKKFKDQFKIFGIVGKSLTVNTYFQQAVAGKYKAMTPGELGCSLSHIEALKDFLASDQNLALIFEDDVIERFEVDLDQLEQDIQSLNLAACFLLSLGGIQMKICRKTRGREQSAQLFGQALLKVDPLYYENLAYAYAYVVDRKMAQVLLDFHQPPRIYDEWMELANQPMVDIYVSYIFDHPQLDPQDARSYLEHERERMKQVVHLPVRRKTPYILKKIRGLFLQKYKIDAALSEQNKG